MAARRAGGDESPPGELEKDAVAASRDAGVTLTGAFDDQVAVLRGGCHLADNRRAAVVRTLPVPRWHVAVWVPDVAIPKERVRDVATDAVRRDAERLAAELRPETVPSTMTKNGELFLRLYRAAGLPVDARPVEVALAAGALGAGLSGTGPAVAALFDSPTRLPAVPGGSWAWTRVAEGMP